jgi:MtN3 and saliva related transmembrane protein
MVNIEYVGFIAGFCTTIAFFPQLIKIIRTKEVESISLLMYIIFCTGLALWISYGFLKNSYPIVIANSLTLLISIAIIALKLEYNLKDRYKNEYQEINDQLNINILSKAKNKNRSKL